MPEERIDPYEEQEAEPEYTPGRVIDPFIQVTEPDYSLNSELAADSLQHLPLAFSPMEAQLDATAAIGTGIVAPIAGGITGTLGAVAGMFPGGESPLEKAGKWYEGTRDALTVEPKTYQGAKATQAVGKAMGKVEEGAKFVGSGYAGLGGMAGAAVHGGNMVDAGVRAQEHFRELPDALAEGGYQVTGSPAVAALSAMLPELASLGIVKPRIPGRSGTKLGEAYNDASPGKMDLPEGYGGVGRANTPEKWDKPPGAETVDEKAFLELDKAVKARNADKVAEIINANPAIVAAFDELGVVYMPQMVSESGALRSTASGLKSSQPALAAADEVVGTQLKALADDLVNRYGSTDRMSVEQGVREAFDADIAKLDSGIAQLYDDVLDNIPQGHQVDARTMREYIENRVVNELGGGNLEHGLNSRALSKHERDLWDLTHERVEVDGKMAWEDGHPSYAEIDAYRRDVGEALNGQGPYGNNRVGEVKKTYAELANTQQRAADAVGPDVGQAYKEANKLGETLHQVRANSQSVLGRNLDTGMLAKVDAAAGNIVKGNTAGFRKMIDAIPESQRQAVAMSVLDRIMTGAAGSEQVTSVFLKNMNLLNRNPGARNLLFSYLPKEAIRRYKLIETASKGFLKSQAKDNRSNTGLANAVRESWESGGLWAKLVGGAEKAPLVGEWVARLAKAGPANRVAAAEKFLTSPALDKAARMYMEGKIAAAEKIASRSAAYNRWLSTLDKATRNTVQREGVLAFLFTSTIEGAE